MPGPYFQSFSAKRFAAGDRSDLIHHHSANRFGEWMFSNPDGVNDYAKLFECPPELAKTASRIIFLAVADQYDRVFRICAM